MSAAPGQVVYPAGYSLVGLPAGTVIGSDSAAYSWSDQGAGGTYSVQGGDRPVAAGAGYWAWFACPHAVTLSGPGSPALSVPLGAYHASLIGNPSGTGPVTVTGFDYAARWDPSTGDYTVSMFRQPQTLAVGEAIWVFAFRDTTVQVGS